MKSLKLFRKPFQFLITFLFLCQNSYSQHIMETDSVFFYSWNEKIQDYIYLKSKKATNFFYLDFKKNKFMKFGDENIVWEMGNNEFLENNVVTFTGYNFANKNENFIIFEANEREIRILSDPKSKTILQIYNIVKYFESVLVEE